MYFGWSNYIPLLTERENQGDAGYKHLAPPEQRISTPTNGAVSALEEQRSSTPKRYFSCFAYLRFLTFSIEAFTSSLSRNVRRLRFLYPGDESWRKLV